MIQVTKKYQEIDDKIVLFNDEYYLRVEKVDVSLLKPEETEALFHDLFEFDSREIELEIDVSEEKNGCWYLQLLVPHVLTLPEAAKRRMEKGHSLLQELLGKKALPLQRNELLREEIYEYVKRYNPDLEIVS